MMRVWIATLVFVIYGLAAFPAAAQLTGADTAPGDSCAGFPTGAARVTADADQDGRDITLICNGTTWNAVANDPIQFGDDTSTCTPTIEGRIRYVSASTLWQYCDGSAWTPFKQPRCTDYVTGDCYISPASPDHSANDTDFIAANIKSGVNILGVTGTYTGSGSSTIPLFVDRDNLALSTIYESDIEIVNPPDGSAISIAGDGSPQYRICGDMTCGAVSQTWGSAAGTISRGQYVQLRATSASSQNVQSTITLSYAGSDAVWHLKTTILNCLSQGSATFNYTGNIQALTVDNFSTECTYKILIYGAGASFSTGGATQFSFKPGAAGDFKILVGQKGAAYPASARYGGGGGSSGTQQSGGGASAIRFETTVLAVAGGGGAADSNNTGSNGGSINNCGENGTNGSTGGCNDVGGSGQGAPSYASDGGSNGGTPSGGYGPGQGYPSFNISGGGGGSRSGGGGGYGGGGGAWYALAGGGGGYLNTTIVEAGYTNLTPLADDSNGKVTMEWAP